MTQRKPWFVHHSCRSLLCHVFDIGYISVMHGSDSNDTKRNHGGFCKPSPSSCISSHRPRAPPCTRMPSHMHAPRSSMKNHPQVQSRVTDTENALANFDGLTYGKGASLLKQLNHVVGPEGFKIGMQVCFFVVVAFFFFFFCVFCCCFVWCCSG
jgi:hypothetical protein